MPYDTITNIAQQVHKAFTTGQPYQIPWLSVADLRRMLHLLKQYPA